MSSKTRDGEQNLPSIGSELRARRLGFALRGLAAELVDERRTVAELRREVAELRAQLAAAKPAQDAHGGPFRAPFVAESVEDGPATPSA